MPVARALQIARIALMAADVEALCAFYEQALGFVRLESDGAAVVLRLGEQEIELHAADKAQRRYPRPRAANDPWFQHFAIVVNDMERAYARLASLQSEPISHGGPQRLPPSTGSVTAYKFRDPEGHPLELSHIPNSAWTRPGHGPGPLLGIDHPALAVGDLGQSLAFYSEVLGFQRSGRSLNQGPEQDRLDGLSGAAVDIVSLTTQAPGPHIELLHYRSPPPAAPIALAEGDLAATRLIVRVADLDALCGALRARGLRSEPCPFWAGGVLTQDPDGHFVTLIA